MRIIVCLFILFNLIVSSVTASPRVVTSITPLFQVTRSIMQGVAEPTLLIGVNASTHHFTFKPSHRQAIDNADLVIWIDRNFESGFQKLPEILPKNSTGLELLRAMNLERENGHIWYSPTLLLRIIEQIKLALIHIDVGNATLYRKNALQLTQLIETWASSTRSQLAESRPKYLLDHDFLVHFEADMGIKSIASVYDSNEQAPGIHELKRIERVLEQSPALCLLTNEVEPTKLSLTLANQFDLPTINVIPAFEDTTDIMQDLDRLSLALLTCS
jgi:zinc transport system substrate-binding protein